LVDIPRSAGPFGLSRDRRSERRGRNQPRWCAARLSSFGLLRKRLFTKGYGSKHDSINDLLRAAEIRTLWGQAMTFALTFLQQLATR
jgi:hypothetical protein